MPHRVTAFSFLASSLAAQIVPAPQRCAVGEGTTRAGSLVRCAVAELAPQAEALADGLARLGVADARVVEAAEDAVAVELVSADDLADDGYRITCPAEHMVVAAASPRGAAHAAASLLQLAAIADGLVRWPRIEIEDHPALPYRSFMVDMGRNPHSPATLRRVVDMLWYYKGNLLHLHLTDDQLFSWPSAAFPKLLSETAGWTREDFVALERYATARGVTIVPELDVPGHSTILRRRYPEVFGKTATELATLPEAQRGVETLIAEMLEVFPSTPYFHVGGDEAYGVPEDVQRAFLNRLNAFVRAQGRRMVVWEGPGLGAGANKVDTDVLHVNWKTVGFPAQQMLDAGYEVVAAPWDPFYIVDHYPRTMFTAVDLERCYGWDEQRFAHVDPGMPTFAAPDVTTTAAGILGFCMPWWEGREENLFPLCLPRFAAVAAAAWNRAGESDFPDFLRRQEHLVPRFVQLAGIELPALPFADPATQRDNLAFRAAVTASAGSAQPPFTPDRLTNGLTDRFDHFLGYPTAPEPLEITITLQEPGEIGRVVVYETAVGESHEVYELLVSADGSSWEKVGEAGPGSRGTTDHVVHRFAPRPVAAIRVRTRGCHGLTFPSFSRLCEVMAFRE